MKQISSLISILALLCSCGVDDIPAIDDTENEKFNFELQDREGNVYQPFNVTDSTICICINPEANFKELTPVFGFLGKQVLFDNQKIQSGEAFFDFSNFCEPHEVSYSNKKGKAFKQSIVLFDQPVLIIDTPESQPIVSKEERVEGCKVTLIETNGDTLSLGLAGIRGRGNATWYRKDLHKRPYNIKFDKKQSLFGLPKSKHWILLANAFWDRTQIHNSTAFEMARLTDYPWVQSGRFVELILNGEHLGLYYLCEKIRIEKGRIDIDEINPEDISGEALTGGYLLETVNTNERTDYYTTDYITLTGNPLEETLGWEIKTPDEDANQIQIDYIKERQNHLEKLLMDKDSVLTGEYLRYFDIETAINWYLVQEASLNVEAWATRNLFMYKKRGDEKFYVGPPWDFDAWSFGSSPNYPPGSFECINKALYYRYLIIDPYFISRLKEKWCLIKDVWIEKIPKYIDEQYELLNRAARRNEIMFPSWVNGDYYPEDPVKDYRTRLNEMKQTFLSQMEWLDNRINSY